MSWWVRKKIKKKNQTCWQTDSFKVRHEGRQTDRQTDRQAGRQMDRQTDRDKRMSTHSQKI